MSLKKLLLLSFIVLSWIMLTIFCSCNNDSLLGSYKYHLLPENNFYEGTLIIDKIDGSYQALIHSFNLGRNELDSFVIEGDRISGQFEKWGRIIKLKGDFSGEEFHGIFTIRKEEFAMRGIRLSNEKVIINRSDVPYMLSDNDLQETELNIDHASLIDGFNRSSFDRGNRIYNSNCINCHGTPEIEGSIPLSQKFWAQKFSGGSDPFSLYQSITKGYGTMPPQLTLTPSEKYDVIAYIREEFLKNDNSEEYYEVTPGYLASLPKGTSKGPEPKPHHPWSDQDYGDFFINTYELVDEETGMARYHSPGPTPFPDEDYSKNNFAYKGIAVRLDKGGGGVSKGRAWMIFDHDVMRVAGGWTGEGFIDWDAILLNDRHETYPRTIGKLHFETPVGPGWANPVNGSFEDPRFVARDGRQFGPLPKPWADYKGIYRSGDQIVISYSVGKSDILESFGVETSSNNTVFTRTLNVSPSHSLLKMRIAPISNQVTLRGRGAQLIEEGGYYMMQVNRNESATIKVFIASSSVVNFDQIVTSSEAPEYLRKYTNGGPAHYPEILTTSIMKGDEEDFLAVDELSPPFDNPWNCRMKLSGIDFFSDANKAAVCTTDGDVFLITGLSDGSAELQWQRIAAGLFQPLGLKILDDQVYVTCRDQIVRLQDLNDDGETDFYESFNHDHQVSDHFHEFAMGLQADAQGNLYYAKSGRHAREALIPQHGTLIKVTKDGRQSEIIASGFRAANGVCINPDGSFLVTDQQGYWNPMNRINWIDVSGESKFYGNMWGYNPPVDSSDAAMEQPMIWLDMEFDRSPSELLWVESGEWGPLNGSLLSFSYGFGKIQLVLHEEVNGQKQGGVIDIPGMKFYTGVMRGRFHPNDGHLYLCGMEAWSTTQNIRTGDLYRIRYTGQPMTLPIGLEAHRDGIQLSFAETLDMSLATDKSLYEVQTWEIVRSKKYGSERYNKKTLTIDQVHLGKDRKSVKLILPKIEPVDVMTVSYNLKSSSEIVIRGTLQNTIHHLGHEKSL